MIAIATARRRFGLPARIAGYGVGSRLEYLWFRWYSGWVLHLWLWLGPISVRAGDRALRAAWIEPVSHGLTEMIAKGLAMGGGVPARACCSAADPAMLETDHIICARSTLYGLLDWAWRSTAFSVVCWTAALAPPANLTRLTAAGGWLSLRWGGGVAHVFLALSAGIVVFAAERSIAGGAWFGPLAGRAGRLLSLKMNNWCDG
jgi:hypothetical protein